MASPVEDVLAECIDEAVSPLAFQRVDQAPVVDTVRVVAAWTRRTWNMNRGIALVCLGEEEGHPGELARRVKKPIGKALGYIPFLNELGLQLILLGRAVLVRAGGLDRFVDTFNTQTAVLQSIHLVDTDARDLVGDPSVLSPGFQEELGLPGWTRVFEWVGQVTPSRLLLRVLGLQPRTGLEPVKARFNYSQETGRASLSVRAWGQTVSVPVLDAIEEGIDRFLTRAE